MNASLRLLFTLLYFTIAITGCSSISPEVINQSNQTVNSEERTTLLNELSDWKINGKIAFITPTERNSASLYWQKSLLHQKLNLTTYLGINVLQLTSEYNTHTIDVDGKQHTGSNLDELITSLTSLTLPTEALTYWIKALPYLPSDTMTFTPDNLPKTLTSTYNNRIWSVSYSAYKNVNVLGDNAVLPHKIKVISNDLTIIIAIKKWTT